MLEWDYGPKISETSLYLDSRRPRALSFVSHAHSDHIASHKIAIATPATLALAEKRVSIEKSIPLNFGIEHIVQDDLSITLYPAGHVLGSAMSLVRRKNISLLYTGDFKLRSGPTCEAPDPPRADILVMESTYGRPVFRFPPFHEVAARLVDIVADAFKNGQQPIVLGYSLGKAQHIVKILTDAGFNVTEHNAVANLSDVYERFGVQLGRRQRYNPAHFRGPGALDLIQRGVIVAPPQVARSAFVDQFPHRVTIMLSGWALLSGASYRYGVDHVLPISDHADFDELLELVERVQPQRVYSLHGFPDFANTLRARGIRADTAKPDPQMRLFD